MEDEPLGLGLMELAWHGQQRPGALLDRKERRVFEKQGSVVSWQEPCAAVANLFPTRGHSSGPVLQDGVGQGDLLLSVHDGVGHQKWVSRGPWLGIGREASPGPLQPLAYVASSLRLSMEGLAACLPAVSHDAETFLPGGYEPGFQVSF